MPAFFATALGKFVVQILIGTLLAVGAALFTPRAKQSTPDGLKEFQRPKTAANAPTARFHGSITVRSPNLILYADQRNETETIGGGGK